MAFVASLDPASMVQRPVDNDALYEVVNGQRVELPMSAYATWIATRLTYRLGPFAEAHALGTVVAEMLFILDEQADLRRRPDVAFVSAQRWPLEREIPETGDWILVPDLAVEVVSPNDLFEDVVAKMQEYFHFGVQQVWIVLPAEKQVYVYDSPTQVRILTSPQEVEGGKLLPGLRLPVADFFQKERVSAAPAPST
jgi:Uma2 family endonuclease